jgi:hypothetical protein
MRIKCFFYLLACVFAVSCSTQSAILPEARGKQGELIVVIDRGLWTGACGDSIRRYLACPIYGLPAAEPMFTLLQQDVITDLTQHVRNILMITVDRGYERAALTYQNDVYARNQLLFNIQAPSADSVVACVRRHSNLLVSSYLKRDKDSYILYYEKVIDPKFTAKVQEKFQVGITIPKEYSLDVEKDDFVWFAREERDLTMGILIWKEPYTATGQLEPDRLVAKMNEMTKKYVPGSSKGSYMADEPLIPPAVKQFVKDDIYTVQLNGLWQMEHDFMGGPYVNLSIVDTQRGQIVTGLGFVFFPRKEKRDYIRQLEAILSTMKPTD